MTKPLTFLTVLLLCSVNLLAERNINLKKNVEVSGHLVLLKDLLIDSSELSDKEKNLVILKSPQRGFKNYRPIDVAFAMQNHASLLDLVIVDPPSFVKLIRIKDVNFVEKVKTELAKSLKQEDPWKRFTIEVDFTPDDINKINEMSGADFKLISQIPSDDLGSVKLSVKFTEKEKNRGTVTLEPVIRRKIFSITLKSDVNKGDVLRKDDLVVAQVWVDGQEDRYASNFKECVGYELSRNMIAGSRVPKPYLVEPVYVRKGEIIKVYVETAAMRVGIHAKALSDGRRGETIRAKNTKSGKNLDVIMTGLQTAVVK